MNSKPTDAATAPAKEIAPLDRQLLIRISRGDEAAFVQLIDLHGESLRRLIGRLTAWHADGDDILQDVFLTVWQKAGRFDGRGSVQGWLKKIAANRCRNHFRTLNSIARKIEGFANFLFLNSSNSTGRADAQSQGDELEVAIGRLNAEDRLVLVMFYLEELPGDEVAEILAVKPETLHVRLHRARKRLKKILAEAQGDE